MSAGSRRSPTARLLAGLAVTLSAVAIYAGYTIRQIHGLRELQAGIVDRNRTGSLLLLRIQNGLNSVAIAMRDMLDANEPYPLTAWRPQFARLKADLYDALAREERVAPGGPTAEQRRILAESFAQFWDALERTFQMADHGQDKEARAQVQLSLQARQAGLSTAVARLLIENNENEEAAAARVSELYAGAERNVYLFLAAMLILITLTSLYLVQYNRRMFQQAAELSERRSELARQLISMQESAYRSISRELHDEFGQILTAIGAMLQRTDRLAGPGSPLAASLLEVREVVQNALDKVRTLSQTLRPLVLDEAGLESALDAYLPGFERQTGIEVQYEKVGTPQEIDRTIAIHLYRIVQEALNNVARHSRSPRASVRLRFAPEYVVVEVEDYGKGFTVPDRQGMGLISMRERAELVSGEVEFLPGKAGGALVRATVPLLEAEEEERVHA